MDLLKTNRPFGNILYMEADTERVHTFKVDVTTYSPLDGKTHDWPAGRLDSNLQTIAKIAAVCNGASVTQSGSQYIANGMPTEAALKVLVEKMGLPEGLDRSSSASDVLSCCKRWGVVERRIATLEFDRDRKSVGVIVKSSSGKNTLLVKGAVENLL
ncbi:calcium-transporting ATPase 1, endoplasmic reticulum-type-like [Papaver somniferum]|uniref:calcium-transporting ATPase 1, endoplasmic reticulum-type-like n=1 Tax=Papaver somniferum TaxID=3469 RepID=UPI000E6F936B|nr:calcium-transporting ATPase 1, endoplasmic reticulum-type-like [Papaver somniferum]